MSMGDEAFLRVALKVGGEWADPIRCHLTPLKPELVIGRPGIPGTALQQRIPVHPEGFRVEEVPSRGLVLSLAADGLEVRVEASNSMWEGSVQPAERRRTGRVDSTSMSILVARDRLVFGYRLGQVSPLVTVVQIDVLEAPGSSRLPGTEIPTLQAIVAKVTRAWRKDLFAGDDPVRWSWRGRMLAGIYAAKQRGSSLDLKDLRMLYIGITSNNFDKPNVTWKRLNAVARDNLTVADVAYLERDLRIPCADLVKAFFEIGDPQGGHVDHRHFAETLAHKLLLQGAMPAGAVTWAHNVQDREADR